jgi:hypothetical protein
MKVFNPYLNLSNIIQKIWMKINYFYLPSNTDKLLEKDLIFKIVFASNY